MKPNAKIVLTNRDHVRDAELFRTRCGARVVAGAACLAGVGLVVLIQPLLAVATAGAGTLR